jgi:hypothetical protein
MATGKLLNDCFERKIRLHSLSLSPIVVRVCVCRRNEWREDRGRNFFFSGMDCLFVGRFSFLLSLFSVEWLLCGGGWRVLCVSVCLCVSVAVC